MDRDETWHGGRPIDREFVTSEKKFANFNEFSEIKKNRKNSLKIVKCPSVGLNLMRFTVSS